MGLMDEAFVDDGQDQRLLSRRISLQNAYEALSFSDNIVLTGAFWQSAEAGSVPLEVLVRCIRACHLPASIPRQRRLIEIIIRRTQRENECWATSLLARLPLHCDERRMLIGDLCADLYESLVRALLDAKRHFWEEHFHHCLRYERQHVYRSFMMREGRWRDRDVAQGARIPRVLLQSLEQALDLDNGDEARLEIEDVQAERMLRSVETSTLLNLVLRLPASLRSVLLLLFWQDQTEMDVARTLNVSDRTVRTRKRQALEQLRRTLQAESGGSL